MTLTGPSDFSPGSTTIDFEGHAHNTRVNELYAGIGVNFTRDDGMGIPIIDATPSISFTPASGINGLAANSWAQASSWSPHVNVLFDFDVFEVGSFQGNWGLGTSYFKISIFDSSDSLIGDQTIAPGNSVFNGLKSDTAIRRARFESDDPSRSAAFDDLIFNSTSPSVPDTASTALLLGAGLLGLAAIRRRIS